MYQQTTSSEQASKPIARSLDIHEIYSNERRQIAISILQDEEDSVTARALSERIAEIETGENPAPRNIRRSVYVSLQQTHLPKLENLGFIKNDEGTKEVKLTEKAEEAHAFTKSAQDQYDEGTKEVKLTEKAEEAHAFTKSAQDHPPRLVTMYGILSTLGLLLVFGSLVDIPVISVIETNVLALLTLSLIAVLSILQIIQSRIASW